MQETKPNMPNRKLPSLTAMVLFIALLSAVSGYLLSKASLVGRTGINLFYTEYRFLKTWWQGAALVFVLLVVLLLLQGIASRKWAVLPSRMVQLTMIVLAAAGLYFTYLDFTNTLSHRLLGEKFHLGAYLFWIGWMVISFYYLLQNKTRTNHAVPER